jgi:phage-related protein (TIGR01555 family)
MDRWQLSARNMDTIDPLLCYDIAGADQLYVNGIKTHASRTILGKGKQAPVYIRRQLFGWGMSEAERMLRDLNNYIKTQDVLYEILDESKIDVYHIEGLANKLATAGGVNLVRNRIQAANIIKNYVNALVLDKNEEFEQKTLAFTGLSQVMAENRIGIASALRMPMTKLFGLSASGFSTGEEDTDNYNQMVESEIRAKMRPAIRECIKIACANIWGTVPEFRFTFPPLKTIKELEAEQIRASKIASYLSLHSSGLVASGKAIGDALAKEEIISAELAAAFIDAPIPPAGEGPAPATNDSVSIFRQAKQAVQNALKGGKK